MVLGGIFCSVALQNACLREECLYEETIFYVHIICHHMFGLFFVTDIPIRG